MSKKRIRSDGSTELSPIVPKGEKLLKLSSPPPSFLNMNTDQSTAPVPPPMGLMQLNQPGLQPGFGLPTSVHAPVDLTAVLNAVSSMAGEMKTQFAALSVQMSDIRDEIKSMKSNMSAMDKGLSMLNHEVSEIKSKTVPNLEKELLAKITALEESKLATELYSKKNNLLFFNVPSDDGEDTEQVLRSFLTDELDIDNGESMLFMNVHRLPSRSKETTKPYPIIAKFVLMRDRNMILNKARTKFSTPGPNAGKKYAVAPHLPTEMQTERKRLVAIRNKLTAEGKSAKIRITGTKVLLFVNNAVWKD